METTTEKGIKITRSLAEHIIYIHWIKNDVYCRFVERAFYSWEKKVFNSNHDMKVGLSWLNNDQIETLLLKIE